MSNNSDNMENTAEQLCLDTKDHKHYREVVKHMTDYVHNGKEGSIRELIRLLKVNNKDEIFSKYIDYTKCYNEAVKLHRETQRGPQQAQIAKHHLSRLAAKPKSTRIHSKLAKAVGLDLTASREELELKTKEFAKQYEPSIASCLGKFKRRRISCINSYNRYHN